MANYSISGATSGSSYIGVTPSTIVPCSVVSARPGVTQRKVWNNPVPPGVTPGSDGTNNLNVTFAWRDNFGLPTMASNNAPNLNDYIAGAQTSNPGGSSAGQCDVWITVPAGVNTIRLGSRTFGTNTIGLYVGKAFQYATRIAWNVGGFQSSNIDLSQYSLLCNRRILSARLYFANGYFNGGWNLTWSLDNGVTFVDVPAANAHGEQPSQSQIP